MIIKACGGGTGAPRAHPVIAPRQAQSCCAEGTEGPAHNEAGPSPALPGAAPPHAPGPAQRGRPTPGARNSAAGSELGPWKAGNNSSPPLRPPPPAFVHRPPSPAARPPRAEARPTSRAPRSPATLRALAVHFRTRETGPGRTGQVKVRPQPGLSPGHQRSRRGARLQRFAHRKPPCSRGGGCQPRGPTHTKRNRGAPLGPKRPDSPKAAIRVVAPARSPQATSRGVPRHRRAHQPGREGPGHGAR